jgi:uncharacterized membrane protein YeaQ/YmgE (transglycosylase-associated protein family)
MGIISWILFGFVVGLLARAILPGTQKLGIIATTLLGIAGSVIGGVVASVFTHHGAGYHRSGWIGSILGALVLLTIYVIAMRNLHGRRTLGSGRPASV